MFTFEFLLLIPLILESLFNLAYILFHLSYKVKQNDYHLKNYLYQKCSFSFGQVFVYFLKEIQHCLYSHLYILLLDYQYFHLQIFHHLDYYYFLQFYLFLSELLLSPLDEFLFMLFVSWRTLSSIEGSRLIYQD